MKKPPRKKPGSGIFLKGLLFLSSLFVLPLTGALVINFGSIFSRYRALTRDMILCAGGFGFCGLLIAIFGPPVRSYVLQHEVTHLLFAAVSGVRVKRVSVRAGGGSVETEKVNILIALAPFAFPLYSALLILFDALLAPLTRGIVRSLVFYPLFGYSIAYHLISTLHYLQIEQPDLRRYGVLPSLVFIFTVTVAVVAVLLGAVFAKTAILGYLKASASQAALIYESLFGILKDKVLY